MKNKFYLIGSMVIILLYFLRMSLQKIWRYQIPISRKIGYAALFNVGISIISINASAQHVDFGYDGRGNRVVRQYSAMRLMNDTAKKDVEAEQIAKQYGLGVYPNPLMDGSSVTVAVAHNKTTEQTPDNPGDAIVYVLDNTGKVLFSQKLSVAKSAYGGQTTISPSQIDLSAYSAGIYHIKVAIGKEVLFYKVTKAK